MPVNSEIFRIYRHLFYGSPLNNAAAAKLELGFRSGLAAVEGCGGFIFITHLSIIT